MTKKTSVVCVDRTNLIEAIIWCEDPHTEQGDYRIVVNGCKFEARDFLDEDSFNKVATWVPLARGYTALRDAAKDAGEEMPDWVVEMVEYLKGAVSDSLVEYVVCKGRRVRVEYFREANDV